MGMHMHSEARVARRRRRILQLATRLACEADEGAPEKREALVQLLTRETRLLEPEAEAERLAKEAGEGCGWAGAWVGREPPAQALGGTSYSCRRQTTEETVVLEPADLELDPEMGGSFEEMLSQTRSMGDEIHDEIRPPLVNANGRPVSSGGGSLTIAAGGGLGEGKGGYIGLRLDLRLVGGEHGEHESADTLSLPPTDLPAEMQTLLSPAHAGPGEPGLGEDWFAAYTPSGAAANEAGSGAAPCLSPLLSPGTLVDAF